MTNKEIIDTYIDNGLIEKCVTYQFAKCKDKAVAQFKDDFTNDLIIALYEYDPVKVLDAHTNSHMNALISAFIIKNLWSSTSPFYTKYRKFMDRSDDITKEIEETYGE